MPSYLWICKLCGQETRIHRRIADYMEPPREDEADLCAEQDHDWDKILETPKVLKESYLMGQRKKSDQAYSEYAKAAEIDCTLQNYRRDSEEYKERKKESDRLKGRDVGETTRSSGSGKARGKI